MAITAPESTGTVTLTIDGREVTAPEGATIWQAAKAAGIDIPVLCHNERFDPVGVCRMCVVEVEGEDEKQDKGMLTTIGGCQLWGGERSCDRR